MVHGLVSIGDTVSLDPVLQKYNIRYVLFPPGNRTNPLLGGSGIVYLLQHNSQWKTVYQDKVCVLMERQTVAADPQQP